MATILTPDGISHGMPRDAIRGSGFIISTTCGLAFQAWSYGRKAYGVRHLDEARSGLPEVRIGDVDCMACVAGIRLGPE